MAEYDTCGNTVRHCDHEVCFSNKKKNARPLYSQTVTVKATRDGKPLFLRVLSKIYNSCC